MDLDMLSEEEIKDAYIRVLAQEEEILSAMQDAIRQDDREKLQILTQQLKELVHEGESYETQLGE